MSDLDTEPGPPPAPLPPPGPAPIEATERRWARSDERVVFGVAGGLARGLAIDPLFVRAAFVVLALFSGVGVLLYLAAFLLMARSPTSPPPSILRRVVGIAAVVVSVRWLVRGEAHLPDAGWVVAFGLLGLAAALWRGRSLAPVAALPEPRRLIDGGSTTAGWRSWTAQHRQRPRPQRSALGMLAMGAAAVVGAAVWLFNDGAGNRGTLAFGWATATLGAGLLVGTVVGRARWLIIPAAVTAAASLVAAALNFAGVGLDHHSGDRNEYLGPGSLVAGRYQAGVGDIDLWMADYPNDLSTSVEVGFGDIHIVVPDEVRVQIDARVGLGSIDVFGTSRDGYRRALSVDRGSGTTTINLRLRVGVGTIDVQRVSLSDRYPGIPPVTFVPSPLSQVFGDGTSVYSDGTIVFGDGWRIEADGSFRIPIVDQLVDRSLQHGSAPRSSRSARPRCCSASSGAGASTPGARRRWSAPCAPPSPCSR
ncbi:MAG TPA: PspC domain-containing protein, partial [Ilumatobacteraceae bacterium]|nr:PspC domain-containing protein [Ilumatobacteraceae bacterium]